ncbi:hypothetical protein ACFL30_02365 [Candidatus Latescibacterota bacterium]
MKPKENGSIHKGFIRTSGLFILLNFFSSLFELLFNGVVARLPDGDYGVYGRLFGLYFIISVPFLSIQLLVSKEVSSYLATNARGRAATFVKKSLLYVTVTGGSLALLGIIFSRFIAGFLNIESTTPVILLMLIFICYTPFPVFVGIVQGSKKFYTAGLIAIFWGFFRLFNGSIAFWSFGGQLNGILVGVTLAVILTVLFAWTRARSIFKTAGEKLTDGEFRRAFSLVIPMAFTLFAVTVLRSIDLVLAGRFFSPAEVDAYACASTVGKAFFMLTTIVMVMFPHVSEQRSLKRNPFIYIIKSLAVTVGLTLGGIIISIISPGFIMRIITVGETIPGAEPLIQIIGIVILCVSIIFIIAHYLLAQHKAGFIPVLVAGMILQVVLISLFHSTPLTMLWAVCGANAITMILMVIVLVVDQRQYSKEG